VPRKDPISGCMVLTLPEFLAKEAEREGKGRNGADIMADIFAELDADSAKQAEEYRSKPALALAEILRQALEDFEAWVREQEYAACENRPFTEPRPPFPLACRAVLQAEVSQSMGGCSGKLVAECVCEDNLVRIATLTFARWGGSRIEPPDGESRLEWSEPRTP